jgi:hypothetical protein
LQLARIIAFVFAFLNPPLNPVSERRKIRGNSGVCLSGVKRSEFSRGPDFSNERTNPKGGFTGCLFFGYFLLAKESNNK